MHTLNDMTSHEEMAIGHPYEETPEYALHPVSNGHSNYVDQHDFYLSSNVILDGKFQAQYSPHKLYSSRGSHFYSGKLLAWLPIALKGQPFLCMPHPEWRMRLTITLLAHRQIWSQRADQWGTRCIRGAVRAVLPDGALLHTTHAFARVA